MAGERSISTFNVDTNLFDADQNIDALMSNVAWDVSSSNVITYSFPDANNDFNYSGTTFYGELNPAQKTAALAGMAAVEDVSNLVFQETANNRDGTIRFYEMLNHPTAYAFYPATAEYGGDSFYSDGNYEYPIMGTYAYHTFFHELGHALGLKHGHETDLGGALTYDRDSMEYSMMTYRSYVGHHANYYTNDYGSFSQTLMMYDIAALQRLYGANYATNSTDTVYTFDLSSGEMFVNSSGVGQPATPVTFRTIWDGNGNDTYDLSNFYTDMYLDLSPGAYSDFDTGGGTLLRAQLGAFNQASGHVYNAVLHNGDTRSLIENATGGSGNDQLVGNQAANVLIGNNGNDYLTGWDGNDTLEGGAGDDELLGGAGIDLAVFAYDVSQYQLSYTSEVFSILGEGLDSVLNTVENFMFDSVTYTWAALQDLATTTGGPGDEFLVNSNASGDQSDPEITALGNGGFVVTWTTGTLNADIAGQVYGANGVAVGTEFAVASNTSNAQIQPAITTLDNGGFVVSWTTQDTAQDGSGMAIKSQIMDASGGKVGSEFLVNQLATGDQQLSTVATLNNSNIVYSWVTSDNTQDGNGAAIKARIFDDSGAAVGAEFLVNSQAFAGQTSPVAVGLSNGRFVITWRTWDGTQDGDGGAAKAQIFNANGTKYGGEFLVNTEATGFQYVNDIEALDNGNFVITWHSDDPTQDGSLTALKGQIFNANAVAQGAEFQVNTEALNSQFTSRISKLPDGDFVVTWFSQDPNQDGSGEAIKAQVFNADGTKQDGEFLVNAETTANQNYPDVAALSDGNFAVVWRSEDAAQDGSGNAIKARIFGDVATSAGGFDVYGDDTYTTFIGSYGSIEAAIAAAAPGNIIDVTNPIDAGYVIVSTDDLAIFGYDPFTAIFELADISATNGVVNFSLNGDMNAHVEGSGQDDSIVGSDGDNYLHGNQGDDSLVGGLGDDNLIGDGGNDVAIFYYDIGAYEISFSNQQFTIVGEGTDTVWDDVENISFNGDSYTSAELQAYITQPPALEEEFLVNTLNDDNQTQPEVTALANGAFVVTWVSYSPAADGSGSGIQAQLFNADGSKNGTEFWLNDFVADDQTQPAIATLANGYFVASWTTADSTADGDGTAIKAQIVDPSGIRTGAFLINAEATGEQQLSSVTGLLNGNMVATWVTSDNTQDGGGAAIKARIFDASGQGVGAEFLVNTQATAGQTQPVVEALSNGRFVATWRTWDGTQDGDGGAAKAQIFNANGTKFGSEFLVNTQTTGFQFVNDISALESGGFVITWHTNDPMQDGSLTALKGQVFDGNGTKAGAEFFVNTQAINSQFSSRVDTLDNGDFVVTWFTQDEAQDGSGEAIKAQVFNSNGTKQGAEFLVNSQSAGNQNNPDVAALANGNYVVVWRNEDPSQDGSGSAIKAKIFQPDAPVGDLVGLYTDDTFTTLISSHVSLENALAAANAGNGIDVPFSVLLGDLSVSVDDLTIRGVEPISGTLSLAAGVADITLVGLNDLGVWGSNVDNNIIGSDGYTYVYAADGNDYVDGGSGSDALYGGAGDDTILGGNWADVIGGDGDNDSLLGGSGDDTMFGHSGNDTLLGGSNNDVLEGGTGDDSLVGGSGKDTLNGGSDNDELLGGGRADLLDGGDGLDLILGGTGDDTILGGQGNDTAKGASGADTIEGGIGNDSLDGGSGKDTVNGGDGNDTVLGGNNGDVVNGGIGEDTLRGGTGNDTLDGGADDDAMRGNQNNDLMHGGLGDDLMDGDSGSDTLNGDAGMDTLNGDGGADELNGGADNDVLNGNNGNDTLNGGAGEDTLDGSGGADVLNGGLGVDVVVGGGGADLLIVAAGEGGDMLTGGNNDDTFDFETGFGTAVITDFDIGVDTIDLADVAGVTGFGDIGVSYGVDATLDLGGGDSLTLEGISGGLSAADFEFV